MGALVDGPGRCVVGERALTLVEVVIAMLLLGIMLASIIPAFIMVRRSAEIAIRENCATNQAQGYLEQIRIAVANHSIEDFPFSPAVGTPTDGVAVYALGLKRRLASGATANENFYVSPGKPPDLSTLVPGQFPADATVKTLAVPIVETGGAGGGTTVNTMQFRLAFWIQNISVPATATYGQTRGITIVYSWDFRDGARVRTYTRSLRTMLSTAKTY